MEVRMLSRNRVFDVQKLVPRHIDELHASPHITTASHYTARMKARISGLNGLCVSRASCSHQSFSFVLPIRTLTTSTQFGQEAQVESPTSSAASLDPNLVSTPREERILSRSGVSPIGSRRRRAALQGSRNIPFEQLPYQCFQEARQVLQNDRAEKIRQIEVQRSRIERLKEQDVTGPAAEVMKNHRLESMRRYLEHMKILADINDPMVKKRFEDGEGQHQLDTLAFRPQTDNLYRRHVPPDLPLPRRTQMAVPPPPNHNATNNSDERHSRCTRHYRSHRRRLSFIRPHARSTWRIRLQHHQRSSATHRRPSLRQARTAGHHRCGGR